MVDRGFCDRGGPRDTVYSGNMGAIAPIRTANAPSGKFLRLKFSDMQSSVFWMLKFGKSMPGYHIKSVMLNYLINRGCGCGQRSN